MYFISVAEDTLMTSHFNRAPVFLLLIADNYVQIKMLGDVKVSFSAHLGRNILRWASKHQGTWRNHASEGSYSVNAARLVFQHESGTSLESSPQPSGTPHPVEVRVESRCSASAINFSAVHKRPTCTEAWSHSHWQAWNPYQLRQLSMIGDTQWFKVN